MFKCNYKWLSADEFANKFLFISSREVKQNIEDGISSLMIELKSKTKGGEL